MVPQLALHGQWLGEDLQAGTVHLTARLPVASGDKPDSLKELFGKFVVSDQKGVLYSAVWFVAGIKWLNLINDHNKVHDLTNSLTSHHWKFN